MNTFPFPSILALALFLSLVSSSGHAEKPKFFCAQQSMMPNQVYESAFTNCAVDTYSIQSGSQIFVIKKSALTQTQIKNLDYLKYQQLTQFGISMDGIIDVKSVSKTSQSARKPSAVDEAPSAE